ncbi:MAG: ATP-dependent DNA helicase [Acidimicrobiales bacterium]
MTEPNVAELLQRVVATLPAGELRTGQCEMAEAVAKAFATGGNVAVAAGTGTGKSLAYLVPAVLSSKRVVVATATKALQDQLANKDLPLVARVLERPVRWAVLKGRSNYLCRQRLLELERLGEQQRMDAPFDAELPEGEQPVGPTGSGPADGAGARRPSGSAGAVSARRVGEEVRRLATWAGSTTSGDRAELDFEPSSAAWSSLSVAADECPGSRRCPSGGECFAEAARARAAAADVVIVNLHLFGADLRCGGEVLPEHDALVIDEAHELEDILASCLGVEVGPGRLRALASTARAALIAAGRRAQRGEDTDQARAVEAVLAVASGFEELLEGGEDRRLPPGLGGAIAEQVTLVVERLDRLGVELRRGADASGGTRAVRQGAEGAGPSGGDADQRCLRALLGVDRCREELAACLAAGGDEVVWVSSGARPALRSAPLDVSETMSAQVFSKMPVVMTSATLPRGLAARIGAPSETTEELDVGSPFAYKEHGLLYCAASLPDRRRPEAEAAIHEEIEALVLAAGGRTLALFTSRRAMADAAEVLAGRLPWPVLVQGELPKAALLEALSSQSAACLFATMSFWQGVDVPGPALTLVVIDRIPFPRPDDPLMAARRDAAGRAGFQSVDLPRAATLLAQGAGRLIRTATDRGVVAVLDPRLVTASYGPVLVKALPPMRRTKDRAEAEAFLRGIHAEATSTLSAP